jgi:hypothetical protein
MNRTRIYIFRTYFFKKSSGLSEQGAQQICCGRQLMHFTAKLDDVPDNCKGLPNHLNPAQGSVGVSKEKSLKETRASHRFGIYTLKL